MSLDDFMLDSAPADFKRDRWGRPSILQPDGKRKGYTRCSSAAKTIEDTFNLEKWARRNIAYGMAYDSSLVARIIAIGGEPSTWGKAEKDQVNEILEAADAVAKAHKSADIGTAVHHLTHRLDRGEEVNAGPYQADLDAYRQALLDRGLMPHPDYTECRMVNDLLEMAGTADRILKDGDIYRIGDIKTGQTVDFGSLGWAAQLAAYAGGVLYDVDSDERRAPPPIDQTVGYIIHLPAGQGRCDIYEVDLVAGHRAAELANEIRAIRKASKNWLTLAPAHKNAAVPVPVPTVEQQPAPAEVDDREASRGFNPSGPSAGAPDRKAILKHRYDLLNDDQKIAYTERKKAIDTGNLDAVEKLLDEIEPFNIRCTPPERSNETPSIVAASPPDEGPDVDELTMAALRREFERLPDSARFWIAALTAQGRKAGVDWRPNTRASIRRFELSRAIVRLAKELEVA